MVSNCLDHNQPFECLKKTAELVNSTPNASIRVPRSMYKIKKMVESPFTFEYNVQCSKCKEFSISITNDLRLKCHHCSADIKRTIWNFFTFIPLEQQIRKVIDEKFDEIMSYRDELDEERFEPNVMTDVHDSIQYRKYKAKYPSSKILTFVVGTDGALVNRSGNSFWAIQLYQNHLKPSMRYTPKNIIVVGLSYGKKPVMKHFFLPLMKEVDKNHQKVRFMPVKCLL